MVRSICGVVGALAASAAATGQSLNIDFGQPENGPPAAYAGAGLPGVWNSVPALHNTNTFNLLDLDGVGTGVRMWQFGGMQTLSVEDPDTSGDDGVLMDDYLVTFTANLESCIFLYDMQPGTYEVIVYARMPNSDEIVGYSNVDEEPGNPHYVVGGAWPGGHEVYVTYARHIAIVSGTGLLRAHSGIAPGELPSDGAALNGMQVRYLDDCRADIDADLVVGTADLLRLLANWGQCPSCLEDMDFSGSVGTEDLLDMLAQWGRCSR